jgi:hypothetical protein
LEKFRKYYLQSFLIPVLAGIILIMNSRQSAFENVAKVKNFGSCYSSVSFEFIIPEPSRNTNFSIGADLLSFRPAIHQLFNMKFVENAHTLLFENHCALFEFGNWIKTILYQPIHIFKRVIRI